MISYFTEWKTNSETRGKHKFSSLTHHLFCVPWLGQGIKLLSSLLLARQDADFASLWSKVGAYNTEGKGGEALWLALWVLPDRNSRTVSEDKHTHHSSLLKETWTDNNENPVVPEEATAGQGWRDDEETFPLKLKPSSQMCWVMFRRRRKGISDFLEWTMISNFLQCCWEYVPFLTIPAIWLCGSWVGPSLSSWSVS